MEITTYSNFRQNLKSFLDRVFVDHNPLFVTRSNGEDVVVLSKTDYESLKETLHLLSSPRNADRLIKGIEEYEGGGGKEKNMLE
jgi:antitoxin YefM